MLGGMQAVTWTQIAQYIVLIVAYLTPIVILSTKQYGIPIPEFTYGHAIAEITAREQELVRRAGDTVHRGNCGPTTLKPHIQPFMNYTPLNFFGIIFCMMVGTASLPHILMRYFTTPSVREARAVGGVVAAVHLPLVLLGAGLCGVLEAGGLHQHHRQQPRPASGRGCSPGASSG